MSRKDPKDSQDAMLGAVLRGRRKILGLTQQEVARSVGVTPQQIQKYELGTNKVASSRLMSICSFLGMRIEDFFKSYKMRYGSVNEEGSEYSVSSPMISSFANLPGSSAVETKRQRRAIDAESIAQSARAAASFASEDMSYSASDESMDIMREGRELMELYTRIPNKKLRDSVFNLMRSMTKSS